MSSEELYLHNPKQNFFVKQHSLSQQSDQHKTLLTQKSLQEHQTSHQSIDQFTQEQKTNIYISDHMDDTAAVTTITTKFKARFTKFKDFFLKKIILLCINFALTYYALKYKNISEMHFNSIIQLLCTMVIILLVIFFYVYDRKKTILSVLTDTIAFFNVFYLVFGLIIHFALFICFMMNDYLKR